MICSRDCVASMVGAHLSSSGFLEAFAAAMFAGRLGAVPDEREVAEAARNSQPAQAHGPADLLLAALVTRFTKGYARAVEPLSRALGEFGEPDTGGAGRRWLWLACRLAQDLWDDERWHALATRAVHDARDTGALSLLPNALNYLAALHGHSRALDTAAVLIDEVDAVTQATGLPPLKYAAVMLAAARGDHAPGSSTSPGAMRRSEAKVRRLGCTGGSPRCATTVMVATARRSRTRVGPASTRTSWRMAGRWSSWSRPLCAVARRTRPRPRSSA